ncbi:MAG: hypothetical protein IK094_00545, partial [Treponema sp.]|nr:hypothetical protein [Treponema sp.]
MKFIRFLATLAALLFAGMFFLACSNGTDVYTTTSMEAATKLAPPQLSVAAYPGANVLTWDFVPDAANYKVYRTLNNEEVLLTPTPLTTVQYVDTDLQPEKIYIYKVVADTNIETEVSITASSMIRIITSLKKAPEGTSYSDLAQYEAALNPFAPKLSPETITYTTKGATPFSTGNLVVTFPVKAYAQYTVSLGGQGVANVPGATADVSVVYKSYANDVYAQVAITPVSGGTKDLFVTATPYYTGYEAETFTKSVNIEMLNVGTTTGLAAAWFDDAGTVKAKVQFTPATYTDTGTPLATGDYAVYRAEAVTANGKTSYGSYTKLSTTMTSGTLANGNNVYYFIDTGLNKSLSYNYIVVPCKNNGTKEVYGTPVSVTLNAATAAELAGITATITSIAAKTTTSTTGGTTTTTTDANTAVIKFGASGGTAAMTYVTYASEALARMATSTELDGGTTIAITGVTNGTVEQ